MSCTAGLFCSSLCGWLLVHKDRKLTLIFVLIQFFICCRTGSYWVFDTPGALLKQLQKWFGGESKYTDAGTYNPQRKSSSLCSQLMAICVFFSNQSQTTWIFIPSIPTPTQSCASLVASSLIVLLDFALGWVHYPPPPLSFVVTNKLVTILFLAFFLFKCEGNHVLWVHSVGRNYVCTGNSVQGILCLSGRTLHFWPGRYVFVFHAPR